MFKPVHEHWETYVSPSDHFCVDEIISSWYGMGGEWIEMGLPHYVAYDCKPKNWCELKSMACDASGKYSEWNLLFANRVLNCSNFVTSTVTARRWP